MKGVSQIRISLIQSNISKLNNFNMNEILFSINKKNNQARKTLCLHLHQVHQQSKRKYAKQVFQMFKSSLQIPFNQSEIEQMHHGLGQYLSPTLRTMKSVATPQPPFVRFLKKKADNLLRSMDSSGLVRHHAMKRKTTVRLCLIY